MPNLTEKLKKLIGIIERLRAPDGCPWDRKQTPQTFKRYLLEETHELLEAINDDDPDSIREELGDLLFQLLFLNNLFQEKNLFTLEDVLDTISQKMIHRHPHVFGSERIDSVQELKRKWQEIKKQENAQKANSGDLFASIPKSLPALRRAHRVAERAAREGFAWPDSASALAKLAEELAELQSAIANPSPEAICEELGDLLFAAVVVAGKTGVDGEDALHLATEKFSTRFQRLQQRLSQTGKNLDACDSAELLRLWRCAKDEERQAPDSH